MRRVHTGAMRRVAMVLLVVLLAPAVIAEPTSSDLAAHAARSDAVRALGRALDDVWVKHDAPGMWARMAPELQAQWTLDQLVQKLVEVDGAGPRTGESVLIASPVDE